LYRNVLATEMSKVSVAAAVENFETNGTTNAKVVRLSAEELVLVLDSGKKYERMTNAGLDDLSAYDLRTLLVDPPRAGMGEEVSKFASRFDRIIYISCNPKTLAEDCRILAETHEIKRFAVFDQFPYTPHLESGALLVKRK
jgi:tRNA (uracil-5-)-methyltransferase